MRLELTQPSLRHVMVFFYPTTLAGELRTKSQRSSCITEIVHLACRESHAAVGVKLFAPAI